MTRGARPVGGDRTETDVGRILFPRPPLPPWGPGADVDVFSAASEAWWSSSALRALVAACGWEWPTGGTPAEVLAALVRLSDGWDFRGNKERNFIATDPAVVNGRVIPEDLAVGAAAALGLVEANDPTGRPTHVVVLGGLVRACVNRVRYAAELVSSLPPTPTVVVLTARRHLGGQEPEQAEASGLGPVTDESSAALAVLRQAFALADPSEIDRGTTRSGADGDTAFHAGWASYRWPGVEVLVTPSSEPEQRRANTADQLRFWAQRSAIGPGHSALMVTTQIYVPYQHFSAVQILGCEQGCGVQTCGVDAARGSIPTRRFVGRDYLQEIRSALHAALDLHRTLATRRHDSPVAEPERNAP